MCLIAPAGFQCDRERDLNDCPNHGVDLFVKNSNSGSDASIEFGSSGGGGGGSGALTGGGAGSTPTAAETHLGDPNHQGFRNAPSSGVSLPSASFSGPRNSNMTSYSHPRPGFFSSPRSRFRTAKRTPASSVAQKRDGDSASPEEQLGPRPRSGDSPPQADELPAGTVQVPANDDRSRAEQAVLPPEVWRYVPPAASNRAQQSTSTELAGQLLPR